MYLVMVAVACRWVYGCMGGWVGATEVRVSGGVRDKGRERWADRGHDGHDEVKKCVVVRGSEAVVIVGVGQWRRRRRRALSS